MTSLRPWLVPTLLGPLLVMWGLATLGAVVIGARAVSLGTVDDWATLMMWSTLFGSSMGVALVGADLYLLASKVRNVPTGGRAWMSSMIVPFLCYGCWAMLPPPASVLILLGWVFAPMIGAALVSRLLFGTRP